MMHIASDQELKQMVKRLSIQESHSESRSTIPIAYSTLNNKSKLYCSGRSVDFGVDDILEPVKKETDEEKRLIKLQEEQEFRRLAAIQHERKRKYLFTQSDDTSTVTVIPAKRPKHRTYRNVEIRKSSYHGWQSECPFPSWMFAICGFFYKGFADLVECYHCGLTRKGWLHSDDPFVFHKKMKPQCEEVIQLIDRGIRSSLDLNDGSKHSFQSGDLNDECAMSDEKQSDKGSNTAPGLECKICLVNTLEITVRPCGHFVMCGACCERLIRENRRCPVCRGVIQDVVKTLFE